VLRGKWVALVAAAVLTAAGGPALAEGARNWAGPYHGLIAGTAWGNADYRFNTGGWYNDGPGDAFSLGVAGRPLGMVLGYDWQRQDLVYGVEFAIISAVLGVSHWNVDNPYAPGTQDFDLKGHWFTSLTGHVGLARGPMLLSVHAGPALAHLVAEAHDTAEGYFIWTPGSVFGIAVGAGLEVAVSRRVSLGLGYQLLAFLPFRVAGESIDRATGMPAGPETATDHAIRYTAHAVTARMIVRPWGTDAAALRPPEPAPDWSGPYLGIFGGALHQIGLQAGYDRVLAGNLLAGVSGQVAGVFCVDLSGCGRWYFEGGLNVRLGYLVDPRVLLYAKAGLGYIAGSFFDVLGGPFYTVGGGLEVALSRRVSGFMELKGVGAAGGGLIDANFQGGYSFRLN
jgi:outer membrane immunogenic protein